ncbi:T9SS type A sorting domain-containing protein [Neolewinella sp.]|uniref:T9SS type A sorting domain-containing protein n=1 Tax=Neolewinella sp. TaxID=2993543 RepID=UPI003B517E6F
MKTLFLLALSLSFHFLSAQQDTIVLFRWNDPAAGPLVSDIGPNAVSVDADVTVSAGGANGTTGLNPGPTTESTNLRITDDPIFDPPGIEIGFDYQRNEQVGVLLFRNNFVMGSAANPSITYRVEDGAGGFTTISSGNLTPQFTDVNDISTGVFQTFVFRYTPSTGIGTLTLDGTEIFRNDGPDNRPLYWVGDGDVIFGDQIDGSKQNFPVYDNFYILGVEANASLPIELTTFSARSADGRRVALHWETATELHNERYEVERSTDQTDWQTIITQAGAGDSNAPRSYQAYDDNAPAGNVYYRLKQVDYDGKYSYSEIESVEINAAGAPVLTVFPNPAGQVITIESTQEIGSLRLYDVRGVEVTDQVTFSANGGRRYTADLSNLPAGTYVLTTERGSTRLYKR